MKFEEEIKQAQRHYPSYIIIIENNHIELRQQEEVLSNQELLNKITDILLNIKTSQALKPIQKIKRQKRNTCLGG